MAYRVRKQLAEEGFAAVLMRKPHTRPSVPRIFDGEKGPLQASLRNDHELLCRN
jgi:hypothetical protein